MKKILAVILGFVLSFTVLGCTGEGLLSSGSISDDVLTDAVTEGLTTDVITEDKIADLSLIDEDTIVLQAISSSMLLSYSTDFVGEMAYSQKADVLGEEEVNDIDYYVEMVEAFLGNEQLTVQSQLSDLDEYDFMVVYTTYNLQQEAVVYTMYYNVFSLIDEEPTTEEPTTEEPTTEPPTTAAELAFGGQQKPSAFNFRDEDDEFVVQGVEGLMVVGDLSYQVEGKILQVEGKQILRLRSYIDENNLVLVNYQLDDRDVDKEKFFFQIVEDGQVVSRSRVMVYESEQMQHVQLEFVDGDDYQKYQFHIRQDGDISYIHIDYRIETEALTDNGHIRLTKTVDPETNETTYSYTVSSGKGNQGQNGNDGVYHKDHRHGHDRNSQSPAEKTNA